MKKGSTTMNLEKMCQYQVWADHKVRDVLRGFTDEEFTREIGPPFGSVKNVCVHIVVAIEYNIQFIEKVAVDGKELHQAVRALSKDELLNRWEKADNDLLKAAQKVKEPIVFPNFVSGGKVMLEPEDFFLQYVTHTVYHRGQLMSLIKSLGKEGVTTDYLLYLFVKE